MQAEVAVGAGSQADGLGLNRELYRQFSRYAKQVFELDTLLDGIKDGRQEPKIATSLVMRVVFMLGLLRIRSFNAVEPRLARPQLQRALGLAVTDKKALSADTLAYSLDRTDVGTAREALVKAVRKAERNKVFREGWHGGLRYVAVDGWEPFSSYDRHCECCLTRQIKVGPKEKQTTKTQYYHSFVVALLLGDKEEVVLDFEEVLSADARKEQGQKEVEGHEGELTAAKRLVKKLRTTYGKWLEVLVCDALYSNGPFLTLADECGFSVIATVKKTTDEPLKEALDLWQGQAPHEVIGQKNGESDERIELWDCPDIQTLSTYAGKIRVVRAVVYRDEKMVSSWCWAVTGLAAKRLSAKKICQVGRGRWHIENTGFYQFAHYWRFSHVFRHTGPAIRTLFYVFFLAFNLLQLFVYRQVRGYCRERGNDPTKTIWSLIDQMLGDIERLTAVEMWDSS